MEKENNTEPKNPVELYLYAIAMELSKIRQIMEADLKQKSQMTGKYSTMMRDFFTQKQEQ